MKYLQVSVRKTDLCATAFLLFIFLLGCRPESKTDCSSAVNFQSELAELLDTVQLSELYADSKTFVDFPLKISPDSIMKAFNSQKAGANFNLRSFIACYFDTITVSNVSFSTHPEHTIIHHIDTLWHVLARNPDAQVISSLIALNHPYIVPGGRFREIYYWDSYFTMLGLAKSDRQFYIKCMVDNFADLLETYGHIPNGNRTYYLSRSQPPFFAPMIELLASINDSVRISDYLSALETEYNFWMKGKEELCPEKPAINRTVRIDDSTVLNRYWDDLCLPRPEAYKEDITLYELTGRDSSIFRDIRAAAESGWDFSSRWFGDTYSLGTIITTHIVPIDLNCLLYNLENMISMAYLEKRDTVAAGKYRRIAGKRARAIDRILWNAESNFYHDYNYIKNAHTGIYSLAAMYPLFFEIADSLKAFQVKNRIVSGFLCDYGVVTTLTQPSTKEQWDYPNGWAPLQWISIKGLANYGYQNLAMEIADRWMDINEQIFYGYGDPSQKGKLLEKYDVVKGIEGRGGEYPLQDGFGWTNGVYMKLN